MASGQVSPKVGKVVDIPANAPTIGTATDLALTGKVSVAFTAASTSTGGPVFSYRAVSNPGSIVGTGTSSPITVSGLTDGTAYTFTVAGVNPTGNSPLSSASNSVIPTVLPTAYESIASLNGTGSSTSFTFTSIPSTYKHLQIRGIIREASGGATNGTLALQFNSSGNSLGRTHWNQAYGNGSWNAGYDSGDMYIQYVSVGSNAVADLYGHFIIDILDYSNSSKNKVIRNFYGVNANNNAASTQCIGSNSNLWINTSAINAIRLVSGNGNPYTTLSNVAIYGIRES
jgi:hypothetical protein